MSCKGRRITKAERVERFDWHDDSGFADLSRHESSPDVMPRVSTLVEAAPVAPAPPSIDLGSLEREAFAKGFAQGERSGGEAAATRGDAMLRRLSQTLDDLVRLRAEMIHKTERQVVELAIAVATRIVHREIAVDRELLVAMARVALDRLGDAASATIRLHPEDYAAIERLGSSCLTSGPVTILADSHIHRGGCLVESDFGVIDVSVDAQVEELTRALLSGDDSFEPVPVHVVAAKSSNAGYALEP